MSAVCILTPIVIAGWPAFSAAVVAAATSLGYQVAAHEPEEAGQRSRDSEHSIQLSIDQSELVTDRVGRNRRICVSRDGVTVAFSRDARGRAALCVTGEGRTDDELRAAGEALSQRVVQQYVYQRLTAEMQARHFVVVEEEVSEDRTIRLKVRHWDNAA